MEKAPKSDTPAKPSERITGSKTNPRGSASSANEGIELSDDVVSSLEAKVAEHNKDSGKKATLGMLKAVWRRGAGAFSSSHSPVVKSRQQWAMARVNAFLHLLKTGSPRNPKYTQDNDLLPGNRQKRIATAIARGKMAKK
jgi:hypothetical protein